MGKERNVRIYGAQREDIDIDLLTHIVMQLGRQLAQEMAADDAPPAESSNDGTEAPS